MKQPHLLLAGVTGSGKTTFCLETAKQSKYTILLSPTRVIVDQMLAEARKTNLTILNHDQLGDWAFGELQLNNNSKIWIGTFAALKKAQPDCKLPEKAMDYLKRNGLISVEDVLR